MQKIQDGTTRLDLLMRDGRKSKVWEKGPVLADWELMCDTGHVEETRSVSG